MTIVPKKSDDTLATAIVKFHRDGSMTCKLTSCEGITARKLDGISALLWRELQKLRADERRKDSIRVLEEKRVAAEAAEKEKANA